MRHLLTPLVIVFAVLGGLQAQQLAQYSLYNLNPYAWNPAAAGTANSLVATGVYRQQWTDLPGAPVGQQVNVHFPVYRFNSGLGLKLDNDAIGAHRSTQVLLSYAYQLDLGNSGLLSFGLSGGYLQYVLDGAKLRAPQGTYNQDLGLFSHNDLQIPEGKINASTPVFEAGIRFQRNNLTAGIAAVPAFIPEIIEKNGGSFRLKNVQHYLITGSYWVDLGDNWALEPTIFAKTDFFLTQLELSINFHWQRNIFAGVSFRGYNNSSKDALVGMTGWRLNEKTILAYAYDFPLSALKATNRGSHELLVQYNLNKPIGRGQLPPIIFNPRFW